MPLHAPLNPGSVVWSGENHGILLKEDPEGPWSALMLFFRLHYSPEGGGTALLLYEQPDVAASLPEACNVMISDNPGLARYLMNEFIGKLGNSPFAASPAFPAVQFLELTESRNRGDAITDFTEIVKAPGVDVELVWQQLGTPTALELPKELTGGKENDMYSLLIESRDPRILVNGRTLRGKPVGRVQAGIETTTAFLYFSESWIRPA